MKKVILYLLAGITGLVSPSAWGQLTASLSDTPTVVRRQPHKQLVTVLNEIGQHYNVHLNFDPDVVRNKVVTEPVRLTSDLHTTLVGVLRPLELNYEKVTDSYYVIIPLNARKPGESIPKNVEAGAVDNPTPATNENEVAALQVGGTVTDEEERPLPGATVAVKGTAIGTTTNAEGQYTLRVPDGVTTLLFSFIGYNTQEVAIGNQTTVNVRLKADIKSLNEVVVIGYGTQKREDVSSAIGSVRGDELKTQAVSGADQALQGKLAGVNVTSNDGAPGGSTKVTIRGIGSLNNTEPLYVIDGIVTPGGLTNIAASDIESVDVLKDASAAAIYGLQGANGVVIVTTKRGRAGKPRVTVDAYYGVSRVWQRLKLMNPQQYAQWNNESIQNTNVYRKSVGRTDTLLFNPAWTNPASLPATGTDWQDQIFQDAPMQDYQLGVSGGRDGTNYAFSLGYRNQDGVVKTYGFKRYNFRTNIDQQVNSFLKMGLSLSYSFSRTLGNPQNNILADGVIYNAMAYAPGLPVRQPGYEAFYSAVPSETVLPSAVYYYGNVYNPLAYLESFDRKTDNGNLFGSLYAEIKLPLALSFRSQLGAYRYDGNQYQFRYLVQTPWDPSNGRQITANGLYEGQFRGSGFNWDNTLTFTKQIGQHSINALVGLSLQQQDNYSSGITQGPFVSEAVPYLGYGNPTTIAASPTSINRVFLRGLLGRVIYGYKSRYLLTANIRRDESSRFAPQNRMGVFPSASVAWRLSEEPFIKNVKAISDLKLRMGWGRIGSQNGIPSYPTYAVLSTGQDYNFGGVLAGGVAPRNIPNSTIRWETSESKNIGLDVGLLNNAVSITLDYYIKDSKDILLALPVPAVAGVGFYPAEVPGPVQNVGQVRNSGLEMSATYRGRAGDLNFSVSGNGTFNKNEIISLGGVPYVLPPNDINQIGDYVSRFGVGQPIGAFYGYVTDGIFQTAEELKAANDRTKAAGKGDYFQQAATAPGDIRFKDINNDGVINASDRTFIGNPNPRFSYGLNLTASYKGFDVLLFGQGVQGVAIFNALRFRTEAPGGQMFNRTERAFVNRWTGPGTSDTYARLIVDDPNNNNRISDRFVEDGSYLRLRTFQFGYSLPKALMNRLKMERLRVYIQGQNLLTFTKYSGLDPEIGVGQYGTADPRTNYDLNIDRGIYPQPRTWIAGLNLTF